MATSGTPQPYAALVTLLLPLHARHGLRRVEGAILLLQVLDEAVDAAVADAAGELGPVVGDEADAAHRHVVGLPAMRGFLHVVVDRHGLCAGLENSHVD